MSNLYINLQILLSYCRSVWYHVQLATCRLLIALCR